jgi:hypothetical protein
MENYLRTAEENKSVARRASWALGTPHYNNPKGWSRRRRMAGNLTSEVGDRHVLVPDSNLTIDLIVIVTLLTYVHSTGEKGMPLLKAIAQQVG